MFSLSNHVKDEHTDLPIGTEDNTAKFMLTAGKAEKIALNTELDDLKRKIWKTRVIKYAEFVYVNQIEINHYNRPVGQS